MVTILIVEDDENLRLLLAEQLKKDYSVLCAADGSEALNTMDNRQIDMLVTDIMMPRVNGIDLVKKVRSRDKLIPILMLTANQSFSKKKEGFLSGTDDYLTKPFDKEEFLWRIRALLRRAQINFSNKISISDIVLDISNYSISRNGKNLSIPRKEFELLFKLLSSPNRIFTKNQLMEEIWGYDSDSSEDTIKTHISRLRNSIKDLEEISILSVKGIGYKAEVNTIEK